MKKYLKILSVPAMALMLFACHMKSAEQAELEKMKALDSLRNEMQKPVVVEQRSSNQEVDFASPDYEPSQPVAYSTQKKKMSAATKGALIGAGAGAASGAVIDGKKPIRGAVLGGVLGAGAGAATGAVIEKKKNSQ